MKDLDEPTLPLSDEHGRFFPNCTAIPGKRLAARIWQLCALPDADHHQELKATLEAAERLSIFWSDPSARNGAGSHPLHVAAILGKPRSVDALLQFRARNRDVNLTDDFGNTALMAAACKGRTKVVELLLLAGAAANVKNKRGYTALGAAVDAAHADCVALLMGHGAVPEAMERPAQVRLEAKQASMPFHWDRGLAAQSWLQHEGMPKQTRRCFELDMQLTKHLLGACPDAKLLETPLDRYRVASRAHAKRQAQETTRKENAHARQLEREKKIFAWRDKIEHAGQHQARREARRS